MNMNDEKYIRYLRYELNYSVHTVLSYSKDLSQFAQFLGVEVLEPKRVTVGDVRAWVYSLSKDGMAVRTVRRKVQSLRAYFRYLQKEGVVDANPVDDIPMAKVPHPLPVFVREKSMDDVLDADYDRADFADVRNRLIVEMLYETGIRRAELITLEDANVDSRAGELKVLGKRSKERIVPFGPRLCRLVETYRALRKGVGPETDRFFVTDKGRPVYPTLVYNVVTDALSSVTASKRSPHVLRHSFASAMLNHGAGINSVKELLGHESLAATQVYTHITYRELKQNYKHAHPRALKKGG
ncbi:MAG: tyrosine-type recombinase/integrase [Candidatus Limisoma sp.]